MRELHGVLSIAKTDYKPYALFFDKLHVFGLERYRLNNESSPEVDRISAELSFLEERGVIQAAPIELTQQFAPEVISAVSKLMSQETPMSQGTPISGPQTRDVCIRSFANVLPVTNGDVVPICEVPFPEILAPAQPRSSSQIVLSVAFGAMPVPDETCAWDDILHFKTELHDKQWAFRRFLQDLATKQRKEPEISDQIEWMVNEYSKAMEIHRLKASNSFVDVFLIPTLELIEDIVKLNWSKIAKGTLSVKKRKVELLEAEMKASGRECAYVFDARKRFGPKS